MKIVYTDYSDSAWGVTIYTAIYVCCKCGTEYTVEEIN